MKNTHGQPSLSQKEGPRKGDFWLLALSRVRDKVKILSLLGKQTVCAWVFQMKFQEMRLDVSGDLRSPPGSLEKGGKYTGLGIYHGPLASLLCGTWGSTAWLIYFLTWNMRIVTPHLTGEPL